jgi:hypothetical protein
LFITTIPLLGFELFFISGGTDLALVDEMVVETLLTISVAGGVFGDSLALEEALSLKLVGVVVVSL